MNRTTIWVFVYIAGFLGILFVIVRFFSIPTVYSHEGLTVGEIHATSTLFGLWIHSEDAVWTNCSDDSIPISTIFQSLSVFINTKFSKQSRVLDEFFDGDAWGQKYNVERRSKTPIPDAEILSINDNPILIWSSGANGRNEFGGGDDICDETNWRIFRDSNP